MKIETNSKRLFGMLLALGVAWGGSALAQDEEQGKPDRMLRLLPLGDPPPWEEVNDGVRRTQKDPPPGSVPPQELVQMDAQGTEKGDPVRLRLGQLSDGLPVGASVSLYDVEEVGAGAQPWLKLAMPRGKSHGLAVIWRDLKEKKWTKADMLILPEDLSSFPPGAIRFVNVSPFTAHFTIAGQTVKLAPGKHATSRPRPAFKKQPLEVHIADPRGNTMKIGDEAINQDSGERTTIFVFLADGEKARAPAKVKVILENTRALPQLPRRDS